jgi:hypothetical protein
MGNDSSRHLTVACLKWGTKYSVDYVNILYSMVQRHLSAPHRFVCLTDDPTGIACETLPIVPNLPTWWGKLTLFNHPLPGRILYLDLDTVIVDGIDGFAAYDGPFCLIKPFYRDRGFASGVMSIAPDFGRHVWEKFARNPQAAIDSCRRYADPPWNNGDQRWLELTIPRADYWQDVRRYYLPFETGQLAPQVHLHGGRPIQHRFLRAIPAEACVRHERARNGDRASCRGAFKLHWQREEACSHNACPVAHLEGNVARLRFRPRREGTAPAGRTHRCRAFQAFGGLRQRSRHVKSAGIGELLQSGDDSAQGENDQAAGRDGGPRDDQGIAKAEFADRDAVGGQGKADRKTDGADAI